MNKAIRFAIAAAFGVATVLPAFAQVPDAREAQVKEGQPAKDSMSGPINYHNSAYHRSGMSNLEWSLAASTNEFGSPAGDMATDREIRLGSNPGNIAVNRGETVKFLTSDGREFRWRFDTLKRITSFPLASIAPDSSMSGKVFVNGDSLEG